MTLEVPISELVEESDEGAKDRLNEEESRKFRSQVMLAAYMSADIAVQKLDACAVYRTD